MSDADRALIEAYNEAWNRQDLDAVCIDSRRRRRVREPHRGRAWPRAPTPCASTSRGIFERWPSLRFRGRRL